MATTQKSILSTARSWRPLRKRLFPIVFFQKISFTVTHLSEIISPDWPPEGRNSTPPPKEGFLRPCVATHFWGGSASLALLRWTYLSPSLWMSSFQLHVKNNVNVRGGEQLQNTSRTQQKHRDYWELLKNAVPSLYNHHYAKTWIHCQQGFVVLWIPWMNCRIVYEQHCSWDQRKVPTFYFLWKVSDNNQIRKKWNLGLDKSSQVHFLV